VPEHLRTIVELLIVALVVATGAVFFWLSRKRRARTQAELLAAAARHARQEQALAVLTGSHFMLSDHLEPALREISEVVSRTLEVDRVGIWRFQDGGKSLVCLDLFEAGARRHSAGMELQAENYLSYFGAKSHVLAAHDAHHDARTAELLESYLRPLGISSMMDTPIHAQGRAVGVLCCEHVGPAREWAGDEQTFAVAVANLVSALLAQVERRRTEQELRWKTALHEAQVHSSLDGILIVDAHERKILQNQRMLDLWNIPPEIAAEEDDRKQIAFVLDQTLHPEQFVAKISHIYSQSDAISHDEIELKNGKVIERYSAPVRGADGRHYGRIWTFRDITERKRAEATLAESRALILSLLESTTDLIWSVDAQTLGLLTFNTALRKYFEQYHGVEPRAGMPPEELMPPACAETWRGFFARTLCEGSFVTEYETPGRTHVLLLSLNLLRRDGEVFGISVFARDITERKRLEMQFRQAQKMEAIGTLAGGIAHDFNNILAAILGYTELARQKLAGRPEGAVYLDDVLAGTRRAIDLVRQMLAFSRREEPKRKLTALRPVVHEALRLLRATIPAEIEFEVALADDAADVLADATQIHQIVMNLATNAAHAMKGRTGRLGVVLENFEVDAALAATHADMRPGRYVRLSISDTGHGMETATLERIFEPFFTTKGPGEGTGLGLSVVHGIVRGHDGVAMVHSRPGEGTIFRLYFPANALSELGTSQESAAALRIPGDRILSGTPTS